MLLFVVEHNKILLVLWNMTAKRIPESYTGSYRFGDYSNPFEDTTRLGNPGPLRL